MSKIAIVYWSGTGNTEAMADLVAQGVRAKGATPTSSAPRISAPSASTNTTHTPSAARQWVTKNWKIPNSCRCMMPVEPLLEGKRVALFGSYDWNDGEWMELWEQRAEEAGLVVVDSVIAKDYPDDDASAECMRLGSLIAQ